MTTVLIVWLILATAISCVSFTLTDWRTAGVSTVVRRVLMIYFFFPIAIFYVLITLSKR